MRKQSLFTRHSRQILLCAMAGLAITGSALAQGTGAGTAKPATVEEGGYSKWDVSPFVGWQWFQQFQGTNTRTHMYESGVVIGERVTEDFSRHFALEEALTLGWNRLDLQPLGNPGFMSMKATNVQISADLVYHFQPRTAKTRFFMVLGPGYTWYTPGGFKDARQPPTGTYAYPPNGIMRRGEPAVSYGIGIKQNINRSFGVRFDVRGMSSPAAHLGLPSSTTTPGGLYIPQHGTESAIMATFGVVFRMGWVEPAPQGPFAVPPATLRVDMPAAAGGAMTIAGAHDVCPGEDERLTVNAAGFPNSTFTWSVNGQTAQGATGAAYSVPTTTTGARTVTASASRGPSVGTSAPYTTEPNHTYQLTAEAAGLGNRSATYQWMVNGQPVAGATSSTFSVGDGPAESITVRVTAANPSLTSAPTTLNVRALTPPTIRFAVNPNTMPYTAGPVALAAVATPSPCGGPVTIRYSGEAVTGSSFNPGGVSGFDMGNRVRQQSKVVTITATGTDTKGQTISATAPVTVTLGSEARRLDDVVFQSMSSRVNNCGKRLLLEELTPMLRNDPGGKVVLIGHRDEKEKGTKAAAKLDEARVLNAAAVLSAGKGVCPSLDLSRIMMSTVGTDQTSKTRPALCGASTNVKEKSGQGVKESDTRAEYRRVEVWFIPSGAAMPAGVTATAVPADVVAKLGCPK